MVAATKSFFHYEENMRSSATMNEALAALSISLASATVVWTVRDLPNGAAIILLSACIGCFLVLAAGVVVLIVLNQ
jgi:hypothetical protein